MRWFGRLLLAATGRLLGALVGRLFGAPVQARLPLDAGVTHPPLPVWVVGQRRWMRLPLVALPASVLVGGIFFISVGAPALLANQTRPTPQQPIPFDHQVHVQQLGLQCAFCHQSAATDVVAGLPSTQECMNCHVVVGAAQQPATKTLQDAWVKQQAVDWVRVWRMPDHVRFAHDAHIQAGVACTDCHGDIGSMHRVVQGQPMKMQTCVACHQQMNAPTTCTTCHY